MFFWLCWWPRVTELRVTGQPEKLLSLLLQGGWSTRDMSASSSWKWKSLWIWPVCLNPISVMVGLFPVICYWLGTSQNLRCFFLECQLWRRQRVGSRSSKYLWWVRRKLEWWWAAEECEGKEDHEAVELEQPLSPEGWSSWISLMALHGLFCLEEGVVCLTAWQYFFPNGIIWV